MAGQAECSIVQKTVKNLEILGTHNEKSRILIIRTGKSGKFDEKLRLRTPEKCGVGVWGMGGGVDGVNCIGRGFILRGNIDNEASMDLRLYFLLILCF